MEGAGADVGLWGNALAWIQAFLIGRCQTVVLEVERSSEIPVNDGVPQGSVLILYSFSYTLTIDLPEVRLFAEDTAVYAVTVDNEDDSIAVC